MQIPLPPERVHPHLSMPRGKEAQRQTMKIGIDDGRRWHVDEVYQLLGYL
jgi:hypothetical protein